MVPLLLAGLNLLVKLCLGMGARKYILFFAFLCGRSLTRLNNVDQILKLKSISLDSLRLVKK